MNKRVFLRIFSTGIDCQLNYLKIRLISILVECAWQQYFQAMGSLLNCCRHVCNVCSREDRVSDSRQAVVGGFQAIVRLSSASCQAVVRQLSGSHQVVARQLSDFHQVVVRHVSQPLRQDLYFLQLAQVLGKVRIFLQFYLVEARRS